MQSILVTGGSGFIGSHLARKLVSDGHHITIIDNLSSGSPPRFDNVKIAFYNEDIRNTQTITDIVKRERIDTCIHLAAIVSVSRSITNPEETYSINVDGTSSVLEACSKNGVKNFVFASSAAVYGNPRFLPLTENHPLEPLSPYGISKVKGESLVNALDKQIKNAACLRFFNVYGVGQNLEYAGVIAKFAERLSNHLPPIIYGDGKQTRDFISINDIVAAIISAAESGASGVFNIATGKPVTIKDLAKRMTNIFGLDLEPIYLNAKDGDIMYSHADVTKAENMLHFSAKEDLEFGLRSMLMPLISLSEQIK